MAGDENLFAEAERLIPYLQEHGGEMGSRALPVVRGLLAAARAERSQRLRLQATTDLCAPALAELLGYLIPTASVTASALSQISRSSNPSSPSPGYLQICKDALADAHDYAKRAREVAERMKQVLSTKE